MINKRRDFGGRFDRKQTNKQTSKQANKQTSKQASKQINNQTSERKKEETNTNPKSSEESINAQISQIIFVVSAAWRRNRSKLICWRLFSSFLQPGSEIGLNWPAGGRFRRFCSWRRN